MCFQRARILDRSSFAWVYYLATARAAVGADPAAVVTLLHELERRNARFGLATMCIGVGQGIATIIERL